jgi:DNA-binding transcriptional LysR family regulator
MQMGVALLPRRCAESEIVRGDLVALAMPEIRLRRQVRLIYRKTGERSHASSAFLGLLEDKHPATKVEDKRKRAEVLV